MKNTVALDVETANRDRDSVCQIGLAVSDDEGNVTVKTWLIRPPGNTYDPGNMGVHGITPEDTENAPTFAEVWPEVQEVLEGRSLISHRGSFDQDCLEAAHEMSGTEWEKPEWGCTWRMGLTTLPDHDKSYTLNRLCGNYDIAITKAHDAGSDAAATLRLTAAMLHEHNNNQQANGESSDGALNNLFAKADDEWWDRAAEVRQRKYNNTDPNILADPSKLEFITTLLAERELTMDLEGIALRDERLAVDELRVGIIPKGAVPISESKKTRRWGRR